MGGRGGSSRLSANGGNPIPDIRDPEDLKSFFEHATEQEAEAMLERWRAERIGEREQETDTQRFFNYIGWTSDVPEVLGEAAYQKALADAGYPQQLYHSDGWHISSGIFRAPENPHRNARHGRRGSNGQFSRAAAGIF